MFHRLCPGQYLESALAIPLDYGPPNSPEYAMGCRGFPRPANLGHATRAGLSRSADELDLYGALDSRAH